MTCAKRRFRGKSEARQANKSAGFRLRVYWCEVCHAFHVTNGEKSRSRADRKTR